MNVAYRKVRDWETSKGKSDPHDGMINCKLRTQFQEAGVGVREAAGRGVVGPAVTAMVRA